MNKLVLILFLIASTFSYKSKSISKQQDKDVLYKRSYPKDTLHLRSIKYKELKINDLPLGSTKEEVIKMFDNVDPIFIKDLQDQYNIASVKYFKYKNSNFYISRYEDLIGFFIQDTALLLLPFKLKVGESADHLVFENSLHSFKNYPILSDTTLGMPVVDTDGTIRIKISDNKIVSYAYYENPVYEYEAPNFYINQENGINLVEKPNPLSKIIDTLTYTDRFLITDTLRQMYKKKQIPYYWFKIQSKGREGYIPSIYITHLSIPIKEEIGKTNLDHYIQKDNNYIASDSIENGIRKTLFFEASLP